MFTAQPLDAPSTDDALSVGAENDLEQHPRRVGAGAPLVIAVTGIEEGKVEFVLKQRNQRVSFRRNWLFFENFEEPIF